jgi:hypothetical protein
MSDRYHTDSSRYMGGDSFRSDMDFFKILISVIFQFMFALQTHRVTGEPLKDA